MAAQGEVGVGRPRWMPFAGQLVVGFVFLGLAVHEFQVNAEHNQHLRRLVSSGVPVGGTLENISMVVKDARFQSAKLTSHFTDLAGTARDVADMPASYQLLSRLNSEAVAWDMSPHPTNPYRFELNIDAVDYLKGTPEGAIPHRYLKHSPINLVYDPEDSSFARVVGEIEEENASVDGGMTPMATIGISGIIGLVGVIVAWSNMRKYFRDRAARRAWLARQRN
jgi:hypothetical protein